MNKLLADYLSGGGNVEARDKLREVAYFLGEMKHLEREGKKDEFDFNLDAFVVAWHSIHDNVILYDLAEKFGLPFTRKQKMTPVDFALKALESSNRDEALDSLTWLRKKVGQLETSYKALFNIRHTIVHRGIVRTERETKTLQVESAWNVSSSGSSSTLGYEGGSYTWHPAGGSYSWRPEGSSYRGPEPAGARSTFEEETKGLAQIWYPKMMTESYFYFKDYPDERIVDMCERAYEDMEQLVSEAEKESWKPTASKNS
jgi:hypothetical protein